MTLKRYKEVMLTKIEKGSFEWDMLEAVGYTCLITGALFGILFTIGMYFLLR